MSYTLEEALEKLSEARTARRLAEAECDRLRSGGVRVPFSVREVFRRPITADHRALRKMAGDILDRGKEGRPVTEAAINPYYKPVDTHAVSASTRAAFHDIFGHDYESPNSEAILGVCLGVARFLMQKNRAYGDSALNPLRVFSKASTVEQLRVRMDDKISRLARGNLAGEDAELDLLGYLILLLVARDGGPHQGVKGSQ